MQREQKIPLQRRILELRLSRARASAVGPSLVVSQLFRTVTQLQSTSLPSTKCYQNKSPPTNQLVTSCNAGCITLRIG